MATTAEVRDRAANLLGILPLGQSLQAQDAARISSGYNEVYERLRLDGLATWTSTGSIPNEVVPHVVALVAENCVNDYGCSTERYQRIVISAAAAPDEISKLVAKFHVSQNGADDY